MCAGLHIQHSQCLFCVFIFFFLFRVQLRIRIGKNGRFQLSVVLSWNDQITYFMCEVNRTVKKKGSAFFSRCGGHKIVQMTKKPFSFLYYGHHSFSFFNSLLHDCISFSHNSKLLDRFRKCVLESRFIKKMISFDTLW